MRVLIRGADDRRRQFLDRLRARERELEVHPLHGERSPQLVARPVDELPLASDGVLDAAEHAVEGPTQPRDLIPPRGLDESSRRVRGGDRGGLSPQPLDRGKGGADQPPGAEPREQEERRTRDRERGGQLQDLVPAILQRGADEHDVSSARRGHRHGEHSRHVVDGCHALVEHGRVRERGDVPGRHDGTGSDDVAGDEEPSRAVGDLREVLVAFQQGRLDLRKRRPVRPHIGGEHFGPGPQPRVDRLEEVVARSHVHEPAQPGQDDREPDDERERESLSDREPRHAHPHPASDSRHPSPSRPTSGRTGDRPCREATSRRRSRYAGRRRMPHPRRAGRARRG